MNPLRVGNRSNDFFLGSSNIKKGLEKVQSGSKNFTQITNADSLKLAKHQKFLNNDLPKLIKEDTHFYLGFTTNSFVTDTHKVKDLAWHNPPKKHPIIVSSKRKSFVPNSLFLIKKIMSGFKSKKITELKNRIIFIPTIPRFIFKCCSNNDRHDFKVSHLKNQNKIYLKSLQKIKLKARHEHGVDVVSIYDISHFLVGGGGGYPYS